MIIIIANQYFNFLVVVFIKILQKICKYAFLVTVRKYYFVFSDNYFSEIKKNSQI